MRLIAVFAHPDDELSCVGTLAKHAARGDEVAIVWTTHGELASQFLNESEAEVRRIRQEHGAFVAGRVGATGHFLDLGDSRMTGSRHEALHLARLYSRFQPDAVLTWSDDHAHPDHRMCAKIAYDAVTLARIPKIVNEASDETYAAHRASLRFYQYPSSATLRPRLHVDIGAHIDLVCEVFRFYQSFYGWSYSAEEFRQARAHTGREAGVTYAESFQIKAAFAPALEYLP